MAKKNIPYDQKYYDPEIECMPRPELEQMQLERLQEMVQYAFGRLETGGSAGLKAFSISDVRWEWSEDTPSSWQEIINSISGCGYEARYSGAGRLDALV